jgi:hypothetical protein
MVNFSVGVVSMVNPPIVGMILDITSKQYGLLDLKVYQFAFLYLLCFISLPMFLFRRYAVLFNDRPLRV